QPGVLRFQILQTLHLVALQPAKLLTPAIVRHLADIDRADRLGLRPSLRSQPITRPQLGDDLFRLVALPRHCGPPSSQNHKLRADHFAGGRSLALTRNNAEAEELVQGCLARALSRTHLWEEGTDLRAWLFTILHNQYVNEVRRRVGEG